MDFLRVDVVRIIKETFDMCKLPVMPVTELLEKIKDDQEVWNLYANGYTFGLNQCEKEKTTERVMMYKPRNVVELAAFVAAVRPGFKSMLSTFISRSDFHYGIKSMDELLQTKEIPDSFLMYDEQILTLLQAGGIPPADAYVCCKAIKKKKADKVAAFGERFQTGFKKYLIEKEDTSEANAKEITDKVWTIINDAASYMFCAAHSYSMANDSLYCAYLKAHYPFEFYTTMLKIFTEKGKKEKIAQIIAEMRRYKGIKITPGKLGQDNRDWFIDKENNLISQSMSSVKFISKKAADDLYKMSYLKFPTFVSALRHLQMHTSVNTRQIEILIGLGYFDQFGSAGKLYRIYNEYFNGENKVSKALIPKSVEKRCLLLEQTEKAMPNEDINIFEKLNLENEFMGLCLSVKEVPDDRYYYVLNVDDTYGIKIRVYNVLKGTSGTYRMRKDLYQTIGVQNGDGIHVSYFQVRNKFISKVGNKTITSDEKEYWITKCEIVYRQKKKEEERKEEAS